jgi:hypothetical protein
MADLDVVRRAPVFSPIQPTAQPAASKAKPDDPLEWQEPGVVERVGGGETRTKLERATQVPTVAPAVSANRRERHQRQAIERDVAIDATTIAVDTTRAVREHANSG